MDADRSQSLDALLRAARARVDSADAELLLAYALGKPRAWLYAHGGDTVDDGMAAAFDDLIARRAQGEPVAYLTGRRGFWSFDLAVSPDTLIPRAETERLVELALARIPTDAAMRIADLGTGSGAIALAIAYERPQADVVATDASADALAIARGNAAKLGIGNLEFRLGDWYAPLASERFDAIVSNPPYIAEADPHLEEGDLRYEPKPALSSGRDGLDAIRIIVSGARSHLTMRGWLLLEHGWDQGDAVRALLRKTGFADIQTCRDLEDRDRVTLGQWPG